LLAKNAAMIGRRVNTANITPTTTSPKNWKKINIGKQHSKGASKEDQAIVMSKFFR
jgi:hypothetical protein